MKKTIKTIALSLFTIGALSFASAQKIAHVSLDSLIGMMPETKTAKDIAENYLNDLKKTATAMDMELQTKYADYQANEANMSDLIKKTKQDELQSLQQRIQDFQQQAEQEYRKKYGELTQPIYDKAKKAIEAAAKEGGYKYVLDTSVGNVLYSEPSDDILMPAKKKLDGMPAAVLPGNGATTTTKPNTNTTIFILGFAEAGNSWATYKNYNPFQVKRSAGFGLRVFLPMFGLLGVDYGWGFDNVPGQPGIGNGKGQFHFTIGGTLGEL